MIIHTIYTLTIDEFALAFKRPEIIKRVNVWMPRKYILSKFSKLVHNYNALTDNEKESNILGDKFTAIYYELKIQILKTIIDVLSNYWLTTEIPQPILDLFRENVGHEFNFDNYLNEINEVDKRLNKIVDTYKIIIQHVEAPKSKGVDMLLMITNIEGIIAQKIGNEKLYKLPYYVNKADSIIKSRENNG